MGRSYSTIALRLQILLLLLFPPVASAAQLDFKGIPMGASEAVVQQKFPTSANCNDVINKSQMMVLQDDGDRYCSIDYIEATTIAGVRANICEFRFYADKLYKITFTVNSSNFNTVTDALVVKYGKPSKVTTRNVQNRMGAVFGNDTWTWRVGDNTITAWRYTGNLDYSMIEYLSDPGKRETARREQQKAKRNLKDL